MYTLGNEVDVKLAGNSNWQGAVCYVNFKNATYTIPATLRVAAMPSTDTPQCQALLDLNCVI